jgi:hypothetical protein
MLKWRTVAGYLRIVWLAQAGLLLLASPLAAQVKLGEVSSSLSGTIAPGYTADFGNMTSSNHTWTLGGAANYTGFYHSPNFLSLNAAFFLNQSRANSDYQSISDSSGFGGSANIFSGSRFPGSVSYSKVYNSEGSYAVPGVANYVTHGNSDTLGVNWSESLAGVPTVSANFQSGGSQYSVYGANDQGNNSFRSLSLNSFYYLAGFNMGAYYSTGESHSLIPQVVTGEQTESTHSDNSGYGFNVTHRLPLNGSASASFSSSEYDSNYLDINTSGTIDMVNTFAAIHPTEKLSFVATANYSDNLSGQLIQSVVAAGGAVPGLNSNQSSNSLDLMGVASYAPLANLQTSASVERRTQNFLGENYGVTSYGGSASYQHTLFDGNFNASVNVTDNTSDQSSANALGFSTTENYSNQILGWKVNGSFGYAQNVQTLLVTYMNSFYNYGGNARRRWGRFNVSLGAGASQTALTQQAGTTNRSESYNASMGYSSWITASGSYSKASGQALATGSGLVPVPVPSPVLPSSDFSLYGGDGYSFALSSAPVKNLVLTASYAKSVSDTTSGGVASSNENDQYNALIQYQVRKLSFTSGYSRLQQGFSGTGAPPETISSFYIGVSRWFKFF